MLPIAEEELLCRVALSLIEGVGPKLARVLLSHFGTAQSILDASLKELKKAPGMEEARARACKDPALKPRAAAEIQFMAHKGLRAIFISDPEYPERLRQCEDAPILLFFRGNTSLNPKKAVAIVGTRKNTDYGARATEYLLEGLQAQKELLVVSGLAFGIDALAHRKCLQLGIPTLGVVAHGLDQIYPRSHQALAQEMQAQGGLLTEFASGTKLHPSLFPARNRIVAGLCDVTVVVESDEKGGAMITGYLAAAYNREVAAFPGKVFDAKAGGPNKLIRKQIASLITDAQDLLDLMGWVGARPSKRDQQVLFKSLSEEEQRIAEVLRDQEGLHADELMLRSGLSTAQVGALLLQMEMAGLVKALPGKRFRLS